jgi:UDP-N-acetyl-D-mannosaminuronate dehydrogenase
MQRKFVLTLVQDYDCIVLCVKHSNLDLASLASEAKCFVDVTGSRYLKKYSNNYYAA